jgi:hypothetical protein
MTGQLPAVSNGSAHLKKTDGTNDKNRTTQRNEDFTDKDMKGNYEKPYESHARCEKGEGGAHIAKKCAFIGQRREIFGEPIWNQGIWLPCLAHGNLQSNLVEENIEVNESARARWPAQRF